MASWVLALPGSCLLMLMAGWPLAMLALLAVAASTALLAGLMLQGGAATVLTPILVLTLLELPGVGEKRAGIASGLFFSAAQIGGVVGPLGLGVLYDLSGDFGLGLGSFTLIALAVMAGIRRLARATDRAHEPDSGSGPDPGVGSHAA